MNPVFFNRCAYRFAAVSATIETNNTFGALLPSATVTNIKATRFFGISTKKITSVLSREGQSTGSLQTPLLSCSDSVGVIELLISAR